MCVRRAIGGGSALERERQRVVSEQFDRSWVDKSPSPWKLMSRAPGARYEILWNSHSSKSTIALYVRVVARSLSLSVTPFVLSLEQGNQNSLDVFVVTFPISDSFKFETKGGNKTRNNLVTFMRHRCFAEGLNLGGFVGTTCVTNVDVNK